MIFITVGSQKFQFNRLLIEMDRLVGSGSIEEDVFAQIGYSDYKPKHYNFKEFLDRDEFEKFMSACDKVITHGGTGVIVRAVKGGKKVIALPRLRKFGEHVDDHQLQIIHELGKMNFVKGIDDVKELESAILDIRSLHFNSYVSNTHSIIKSIEVFIEKG